MLSALSPLPATEPPRDCPRCPRLVAFREALRLEHPDWWNAPVPAWGDPDAAIAIVGLAPGKHGANRTGRPFTGDFAGELLFRTLLAHGLATGEYSAAPDDSLRLTGAIIVNAVRCLPPENKPTPEEIRTCRPFLEAPLAALAHVRVVVALGKIAHDAAVRAFGGRLAAMPFAHLAEHALPGGSVLVDSYHCSRYNQNTGKLTEPMFAAVFARALEIRDGVNWIIRPTGYDATAFAPLIAAAVAGGDAFMARLRDGWLDNSNRFAAPGEVYFGVWSGGALVGVGGVNRDPYGAGATVGRVRHLYVRPDARGRGIGAALTRRLIDHARDHFAVLRLRTRRPEAVRMYERLGFVRTDADDETHRLVLHDHRELTA